MATKKKTATKKRRGSSSSSRAHLQHFMEGLIVRNPGEEEFHQAVQEVAETLVPFIDRNPAYREYRILERMTEPDRIVSFRVSWTDDKGEIVVNRGFRVQMNNAIGPYKGGLRFSHQVTPSILKFLAFEQTFKNSLTGLPMGAGKGGANFNPKGKSESEVMRFCQSFMTELHRHIGPDTDVPAGDIGVGAREIGFMFGQHKRITGDFQGVLTGKGLEFGGSLIRTEATGYGAAMFLSHMLEKKGMSLQGMKANVSGSGNVAIYAAEKLRQLGAHVQTLSDSGGFIYDPDGIDEKKLAWVKNLKEVRRGRISEYASRYRKAVFHKGKRPWGVPCNVAMPCAMQNEISLADAKALIKNKVRAICEGANMPTELDAVEAFRKANVLFGPAKAANAGGVAVSGLEMSQNSARLSRTLSDMEAHLEQIMKDIHERCVENGMDAKGKKIDYITGANIAGFRKVADAMLAFGVV